MFFQGIVEPGSTPTLVVYHEGSNPPTVVLSKNGAAFVAATNSPATLISNHFYQIALTADETDTEGPLVADVFEGGFEVAYSLQVRKLAGEVAQQITASIAQVSKTQTAIASASNAQLRKSLADMTVQLNALQQLKVRS